MKLLAFDTSTEACTVALWRDGAVLERFEQRSQHSELLLGMVDVLLAEAGVTLTQLDAIAIGRGPGSFTGLRIGAGVAQGLAFGADLPVVAVSSLAVLAQGAEGDRILAAFDARMQQVYWGVYQRNARGLVEAGAPEIVVNPSAVSVPPGTDWIGAGFGWRAHAQALGRRLGEAVRQVFPDAVPRARHLATLGAEALAQGQGLPAEQAIPLYLRDDVATPAVK